MIRHPKQCKYYRNYKRCKFNPCEVNYVEKIKEICEKLETVEEEKYSIEVEVKEIDARIYIIEHEFKAIEKVRSF